MVEHKQAVLSFMERQKKTNEFLVRVAERHGFNLMEVGWYPHQFASIKVAKSSYPGLSVAIFVTHEEARKKDLFSKILPSKEQHLITTLWPAAVKEYNQNTKKESLRKSIKKASRG